MRENTIAGCAFDNDLEHIRKHEYFEARASSLYTLITVNTLT